MHQLPRFVALLALSLSFAPAHAVEAKPPVHYIDVAQVELVPLLAPSPTMNSATQRADIAELLRIQQQRTPAQVQRALADDSFSVYRYADVLGPGFSETRTPLVAALFRRIIDDMGDIIDVPKQYWHRERPTTNKAVHRLTPADPHESKSYPSGHASFGYVAAIVLARMVPEKRAALFARAAEFAHNRVMVADHYPSDVEAGRIAGTVITYALLRDPRFRTDMAAATGELRRVLGYSSH